MTSERKGGAENPDSWRKRFIRSYLREYHDDWSYLSEKSAGEEKKHAALELRREENFAAAVVEFYGTLPNNAVVLWDIDGTMGTDQTPWYPRSGLIPLLKLLKKMYPSVKNGVLSDRPKTEIEDILRQIQTRPAFFDRGMVFSNENWKVDSAITAAIHSTQNNVRNAMARLAGYEGRAKKGAVITFLEDLGKSLPPYTQGKLKWMAELPRGTYLIDDMGSMETALPKGRVLNVSKHRPTTEIINALGKRIESWAMWDLAPIIESYFEKLAKEEISKEALEAFADDLGVILRTCRNYAHWDEMIRDQTRQEILVRSNGLVDLPFNLEEEAMAFYGRRANISVKDEMGRCPLLDEGLRPYTRPKPKPLEELNMESLKDAYEKLPTRSRMINGVLFSWEEVSAALPMEKVLEGLSTLLAPTLCELRKDGTLIFIDGEAVRAETIGKGYRWNEQNAQKNFCPGVRRSLATKRALRLRGESAHKDFGTWLNATAAPMPPVGEALWGGLDGESNIGTELQDLPLPHVGGVYMLEVDI